MEYEFNFDLNTRLESYEIGKVAKQANGAVLLKSGGNVLLATVVVDSDDVVNEDFLPLTVQYIEKAYARGKIPGGFVKREAKPGEFETLTARVIDRSLRPLFPKGYRYNTAISVIVLSAEPNADLQVLGLNAASAALYISDLPIKKSVSGVRIAKIDNQLVVNPPFQDMKKSILDLYVSGTKEELLMIEMKAIGNDEKIEDTEDVKYHINEVNEVELIEMITLAKKTLETINNNYEKTFQEVLNDVEVLDLEIQNEKLNEEIFNFIDSNYKDEVKETIKKMAKSERANGLKKLAKDVVKLDIAIEKNWDKEIITKVIEVYKRGIVRDMIIDDKIRADGRGLTDVRPISIETNILPNAHSSALFTRGETQALVVATLGGDMDAQMSDQLTEKNAILDKLMVHYNFPPFCVGEAYPLSAPSRRELGHGNLGKKALQATVPNSYDATIRLVSEILESNGSSSMATVCGGSLALKAANVPVEKLVAGIAMGLVLDGEKYSILTDIMGLEDHDGDMDFKVAGTKDGITALQMDIKLGGIKLSILEEALVQAKNGRNHILAIMEIASDKIVINTTTLPTTINFTVATDKVIDIIGQGGKTIKEIIEKFAVTIDLDRKSGNVKIIGTSVNANDTKTYIINLLKSTQTKSFAGFDKLYKVGQILTGKVKRIADFGMFVELPDGNDGLLHISKVSRRERINNLNTLYSEGDKLEVKVLEVSRSKISLSLSDY